MNTQVTATGMQVEANSNTLFLVINEGSTFNAAGTDTSATSTASTKALYPVDHGTVTAGAGASTTISAAAVVASGKLGEYIGSETFSVGVNSKSGVDKAQNLTVTSVTLPADTGIVLVLVCGSNVFTYKANIASGGTDVLASTPFTDTVVTAYYYIDGTNTNVTTDKATSLTGAVSFTLDATAYSAS